MDELLDDAKRMLLVWRGRKGPIIAPMAFWWDGRHVWASTSTSAGKVAGLERDPECVMYVPPLDSGGGGRGLVLRGTARIHRPSDPVTLATHGAVLAAATTALAVKNVTSVAGYLADAARVPATWRPERRAMICIEAGDRTGVTPPTAGPGIAPGLPSDIPPEVRRLVGGQRDVVMATMVDGGLGVVPGVWSAGFGVDLPQGTRVPEGTPCSVVIDHDEGFRPTAVAGIAMNGRWTGTGIEPTRARWWHGFDSDVVDVTRGPAQQIVIPD